MTADLPGSAARLSAALGHEFAPFVDPGVGEFGLENLVFEAGSSFLELLTPARPGTAGGRHLERHGGDAGYMAIFQVDDLGAGRERAERLGVQVVWSGGFDDIQGMHLHPRGTGGAIVSLDEPRPPQSWRWAGPRWTGGAPDDAVPGGLTGLSVAVDDPVAVASRWAALLGPGASLDPGGCAVHLTEAGQRIDFAPAGGAPARITEVHLTLATGASDTVVAGTRLVVAAAG